MSKQARVAPRNIQFRDDVDVRQIPHKDDGGNDGQSWDPNLRNKDVFDDKPKKQRKVVMIVVIGGTVLLLIVIAAVLGGVLSQKSITAGDNSLTYNEACRPGGSQCMSSKNLYCPNGFCVCSSPYSWSSAADKCQYLRYNDACTSASQCDASLQLTCTNSLCKCNVYYTYNATNSSCTLILNNTLTYGATCAVNSSQCISSLGLTCTGNCSCTVTKVWNGSVCTCASTTFLNASSLCEPLHKYNQTCAAGSIYCDTARGLSCSSGICVCASTHYWDYNLEQCAIRRNYSQSCNRDSECAPTLVCPTVPGTCTCPDFLPDYTCDCPTTKYYNSATGQCANRATLSGSCTATYDFTCLMTLECPTGTCGCPTGKTWNATATKCV